MVLRTATKDENVPRPRTLIMVAARDRGRLRWNRGRGRSEVLDNAPSGGWVEIKLTRNARRREVVAAGLILPEGVVFRNPIPVAKSHQESGSSCGCSSALRSTFRSAGSAARWLDRTHGRPYRRRPVSVRVPAPGSLQA